MDWGFSGVRYEGKGDNQKHSKVTFVMQIDRTKDACGKIKPVIPRGHALWKIIPGK